MDEQTRTIEQDGRKVTVARATVLMGMRRTRLASEGLAADETDLDRRLLRRFTYPDCIAATTQAEGIRPWPPSFETFIALPDDFCAQWEAAVYAVNPSWLPGQAPNPKANAPASSTTG
jgi:hypothetical protein